MPPRSRASLGLLLFLAYKGLLRSPIASAMLVLAVAAGESFQIPNTANLAGYEAELLAQGVSQGAGEVRVRPRSGPHFEGGDALSARLAKVESVRAAVPVLTLPGAIGIGGRWVSTPVLGIDADAPRRPFRIEEGGALLAAGERDGILIGGGLASRMRLKVGDRLDLRVILDMTAAPPAVPSASASAPAAAPPAIANRHAPRGNGAYSVTVRGIARGALLADEVVFVDRRFLTEEAGTPGAASLIHIHTGAPAAADGLARDLERTFPEVEALTWVEDSVFLGSAIQGNRALNAISSAMAMIGVAIPVWALLFVTVHQRRREIGLYGALGFGARRVFAIFFLQALVVGVLGVALGALGGYALVRWFIAHPIFQNDSFVIRPVLSPGAILQSVGTILGTTLAAGVYPALRAARIDPARALRELP